MGRTAVVQDSTSVSARVSTGRKLWKRAVTTSFFVAKDAKSCTAGSARTFMTPILALRGRMAKFEVVKANPGKHAHRAHIRVESEAWKESYPFPKQRGGVKASTGTHLRGPLRRCSFEVLYENVHRTVNVPVDDR